MKFGERLEAAKIADFADFYVDYDRLKALIDDDNAAAFREQLRAMIERADEFYVRKVAHLRRDMQRVERAADAELRELRERSALGADVCASSETLEQLATLTDNVTDLRSFVAMNFMAVMKIAKKYNKHHADAPLDVQRLLFDRKLFQAHQLAQLHSLSTVLATRIAPPPASESAVPAEAVAAADARCALCFRTVSNPIALGCSHVFDYACLTSHSSVHASCPVCGAEDGWDSIQLDPAAGVAALQYVQPGGGSFTAGEEHKRPLGMPVSVVDYHGFLLDMDGVLQRHGHPVPGALQFLRTLRRRKSAFLVLTNEDRYTNEALSRQLRDALAVDDTSGAMESDAATAAAAAAVAEAAASTTTNSSTPPPARTHLDVDDVAPQPDEIYTSANSVRDFFKRLLRHNYMGSTYVVGEEGLISAVRDAYAWPAEGTHGGAVIANEDEAPADANPVVYVVMGSRWQESTRCVERACQFVRDGGRLVYSCPDVFEVDVDGRYKFGMPLVSVRVIEEVTGCTSYNLGKPNAHMARMSYNLLWRRFGVAHKDVLFVGDSINTDIRSAIENGIDSALVLSGTTTREKLSRSALQPNFVYPSVKEIALELESAAELDMAKVVAQGTEAAETKTKAAAEATTSKAAKAVTSPRSSSSSKIRAVDSYTSFPTTFSKTTIPFSV